ncbi:hypothetical protein N5D67_10620 [Comamonas aquatica]|uniref:MASE3 domain-containing protein n=1 Tax=Comamonas aquatica TaxID=225991 RepID=UPI00244A3BAB|nr:MASE3 domain-containing protein [Comamonas aquatica]MDH1902751.1 hypothetical protein [Comamonas aquatica]
MTHHRELRESAYWLLALLAGLLLVRVLPAPDAARGLASYLPLHTIMEMLSIAVAAMVFSIAWVTQKYRLNGRALVLGIGLLGVALLDLSHALSYAGMPDFITPSGPEKAINFWLAARAMAAAALLWAALWPEGWSGWLDRRGRYLGLLAMGGIVGAVHYLLLAHPQVIPRTFVPGSGLTPLKIQLEYALMLAYLVAGLGFMAQGTREPGRVYLALAAFILGIGEYFFTLYANVTDVYNLAGHLYKIIAYGFLYRGLFVETVRQPYLGLQQAEARQRATLETLPDMLFEMDRGGVYLEVHANPRAAGGLVPATAGQARDRGPAARGGGHLLGGAGTGRGRGRGPRPAHLPVPGRRAALLRAGRGQEGGAPRATIHLPGAVARCHGCRAQRAAPDGRVLSKCRLAGPAAPRWLRAGKRFSAPRRGACPAPEPQPRGAAAVCAAR